MSLESEQPSPEQLSRIYEGDQDAVREVLPIIYEELKARARHLMAQQNKAHTLQPTALVHEAWARLARVDGVQVQSRGAYLALAATAMRSVLVDHARMRKARKRGDGAARVDLTASGYGACEEEPFLLHLDEAVEQLTKLDATLGRVAELRCFGGLSHPEIAEALDTPLRTVERNWRAVRAWLRQELE